MYPVRRLVLKGARQLLLERARNARWERKLRMKYTAHIHGKIGEITTLQARTHQRLAKLMEQEAVMHRLCANLDARAASRSPKSSTAPVFLKFRQQHIHQMQKARAEAWAHRQLAARSQARAIWHRSLVNLLLISSGLQ